MNVIIPDKTSQPILFTYLFSIIFGVCETVNARVCLKAAV